MLNIPVFIATDNAYAPFASTTIMSVMENTNAHVDFFILAYQICPQSQEKLNNLQDTYPHLKIHFLDIDADMFKECRLAKYTSPMIFARYLIPELFPSLKKAIYTDIDVIFADDIQKLYDENLADFPIGAVYNFIDSSRADFEAHRQNLNLDANHRFFWSGLLLMNPQKMHKDGSYHKLMNATLRYEKFLKWPDLDAMNCVFGNNYQELHPKYIFIPQKEQEMIDMGGLYEQAALKPFIYHFAGPKKPWIDPSQKDADKFWAIACKSNFINEIKKFVEPREIKIKNCAITSIPNESTHQKN